METGSFALANTQLSVQRVAMASWEPGSAHPDMRARLRGVRSAVRFESAVPTRDAATKNTPLTTNDDPGVGFIRAPHISCVRRATTVGQGISGKRRRSSGGFVRDVLVRRGGPARHVFARPARLTLQRRTDLGHRESFGFVRFRYGARFLGGNFYNKGINGNLRQRIVGFVRQVSMGLHGFVGRVLPLPWRVRSCPAHRCRGVCSHRWRGPS
jgi:hypothetical protein